MNIKLTTTALLLFSQGLLAQEYSYIWANQYPALADPPFDCCYDFDGDMTLDDQIGSIMVAVEGLLGGDFQLYPDQLIINNEWVRIFRWDMLPIGDGSVTVSLLAGDLDNGMLNLQGRIDGDTEVSINPAALATFTGTKSNGYIDLYAAATEHLFLTPMVSIAGAASGEDTLILLPLQGVRIRGPIIQNTVACEGVCSQNMAAVDPAVLGGVEISGLLHHADELEAINSAARGCSCAGIDQITPLLSYVEDDKALTISCNYQELNSAMCDESDPSFCQTVENQCSFAGAQAGFYDQDSNNNGIADSKSLGGLIGFAPTTVTGFADLIFVSGFD